MEHLAEHRSAARLESFSPSPGTEKQTRPSDSVTAPLVAFLFLKSRQTTWRFARDFNKPRVGSAMMGFAPQLRRPLRSALAYCDRFGLPKAAPWRPPPCCPSVPHGYPVQPVARPGQMRIVYFHRSAPERAAAGGYRYPSADSARLCPAPGRYRLSAPHPGTGRRAP